MELVAVLDRLALVVEDLVAGALVGDGDPQPLVQERHLAEAGRERVIGEVGGLEDVRRGEERDGGAGLVGLLQLLQLGDGIAEVEGLLEAEAVASDVDDQLLRQRVHDGGTHAVQAAGDLVAAVAELAARVEHGQHERDGGDLLDRVFLDGDAAAVVLHPHTTVVEQFDVDGVAVAGQGLVDGVVDDLVDQVMEPAFAGGPDVHAGTLTHCLETLEDRDLVRVVAAGDGVVRRVLQPFHAFRRGEILACLLVVDHSSPVTQTWRRVVRRR